MPGSEGAIAARAATACWMVASAFPLLPPPEFSWLWEKRRAPTWGRAAPGRPSPTAAAAAERSAPLWTPLRMPRYRLLL